MLNFVSTVDKISPEGKAVFTHEGQNIYVPGLLPGEKAEISILPKTKHFYEGKVSVLLESSPFRVKPQEDHYEICSPLQIATYAEQLKIKNNIFKAIFSKQLSVKLNDIKASGQTFGYRTKLEFQFTEQNNKIFLAYNELAERDHKRLLLEGCCLGSIKMNAVALSIVTRINELKIPSEVLKKLIIRESKSTGNILAILLTTSQEFLYDFSLSTYTTPADGIIIAFSNPQTERADIDWILFSDGISELKDLVLGKEIYYGPDNFFQNNVPVFEEALLDIRRNIGTHNKSVVELYSGVGTIGISIADLADSVIAYEINTTSTTFAKKNARQNNITNFKAKTLPSHKVTLEILNNGDTLIVDPPRAGLNKRLIENILGSRINKIIYLSCEPLTLSRDIEKFSSNFALTYLQPYDFFPNTSHFETLAVLERNS